MDISLLFVSMLAVWRACTMLQDETGPAGIFARFRAWLAKRDKGQSGGFYDGYTCLYCLSMWLSFLPALYLEHDVPNFARLLLYWFAISAGAIFLAIIADKLEQ